MPFPPPPAGMSPPPPAAAAAGAMNGSPAPVAAPNAAAPSSPTTKAPPALVHSDTVGKCETTLKPGTLLVYGDNEESYEEKKAKLARYHTSVAPTTTTRTRARATEFMD